MEIKNFEDLEQLTVEEFQKDFDNLLDRVEQGESFVITSEHGNAVMIPADDEFMKIYTELNNEAQ